MLAAVSCELSVLYTGWEMLTMKRCVMWAVCSLHWMWAMKCCVMWAACSLHRLLAMKRCVTWAVWGTALHYCMQFWDDPFRLCVWSSGRLIAFWSVVWLHHSCMCCEMSIWSHCSMNEQVGLQKKKLLSLYLTGCFILLLYCDWYKQLPSHSLVARLVWTAF